MEKIIVRDRILNRGHVNSSFINLCNDICYTSCESFIKSHGLQKIMKMLYCEEIDNDILEKSGLYQSYSAIVESQEDNNLFKCLYRIDEEFAVHLSENIYLYHLIPKNGEVYSSVIPWFYADSKKYYGDTWWESDDEIIDSLYNLSVLEFLKRYKAY